METDSHSESDQLNPQDEAEWDEWNDSEEGNEDATKSLFDANVLPSPDAAIEHDAKAHGFDIRRYRKQASSSAPAPPCWRAQMIR